MTSLAATVSTAGTASVEPERPALSVRNGRWNMVVNVLDVSFYVLGESIVSAVVVLPAFLLAMGASPAVVALLPALHVLGTRLPPLATSYLVEGRRRVLGWCTLMGIGQRLPWLVAGIITLSLAGRSPGLALVLCIGCFFASYAAFGLGSAAYGELIAKAISPRRRGLFMGLTLLVGNGLAVIGARVVAGVMDNPHLRFPNNYATLFFIASGVLAVSFVFFLLNREPDGSTTRTHTSFAQYLRELPGLLRSDRNFVWYLLHQSLIYGYAMGSGLFMAYALRHFQLADSSTGGFLTAATVATIAAAPVLGLLGDRIGHKPVLIIACAAHIAAAVLATMATDWRVMYGVFALTAICLSAQVVASRNYTFLFGSNGRRPTYLALANTVPAPFILLFSLLGGAMAQSPTFGYRWAFICSAFLCAAAMLVLLLKVKTPPQPALESLPCADIR